MAGGYDKLAKPRVRYAGDPLDLNFLEAIDTRRAARRMWAIGNVQTHQSLLCSLTQFGCIVKSVLSGHSKRRANIGFKTDYRLMQVKSISEESILQYFRPSLSYHLS